MGVRIVFEAHLLLPAMVLMTKVVGGEKLSIVCNAVSNKLTYMAIWLMQKARNVLTKSCSPGPLRVLIRPYL